MIRAKVLPALFKACMCHAEYKKNLSRRQLSPDAHILSQTGRCSGLFSNPDLRTASWGPLLPSSEHDATMVCLSRTACFRFDKRCLATQRAAVCDTAAAPRPSWHVIRISVLRSRLISVGKTGKDSIQLEPMKTFGSTDEVERKPGNNESSTA